MGPAAVGGYSHGSPIAGFVPNPKGKPNNNIRNQATKSFGWVGMEPQHVAKLYTTNLALHKLHTTGYPVPPPLDDNITMSLSPTLPHTKLALLCRASRHDPLQTM